MLQPNKRNSRSATAVLRHATKLYARWCTFRHDSSLVSLHTTQPFLVPCVKILLQPLVGLAAVRSIRFVNCNVPQKKWAISIRWQRQIQKQQPSHTNTTLAALLIHHLCSKSPSPILRFTSFIDHKRLKAFYQINSKR